MPLSHHGKSRTSREDLILAFSLASVAGTVNAIGFLELGTFTSHMSGNSARLGQALGENDHPMLVQIGVLLGSFVAGAMLATLLVERAKLQQRARYVVTLLLEATLLTVITVATELIGVRPIWLVNLLSGGLAFSMGLQNALITHISGAIIRTTHLTGTITDFGIETVRLGFAFRQRWREHGWLHLRSALRSLSDVPDFYKARLHLTIFLSFLAGAAVGTSLLLHVGRIAMALPVAILIALVIYDQWLQNQWSRLMKILPTVSWMESKRVEPSSPKTGT